MVEHLCGYAQRDLVVPAGGFASVRDANAGAKAWCAQVNDAVHSEIAAVPAQRLVTECEVLRQLPSLRPPLRRGAQRKATTVAAGTRMPLMQGIPRSRDRR